MQTILPVWKPVAKTPLDVIRRLQEKYPQFASRKLGYAGRLDPMAEGVLLILVGEENKQRKKYEQLPKSYRFSLVCGITTDTYDMMGKMTSFNIISHPAHILSLYQESAKRLVGTYAQPYPPYSARRVNGKPLYYWSRNGRLDEVVIPQKQITVSRLTYISMEMQSIPHILSQAVQSVCQVRGKFRQDEIISEWDACAAKYPETLAPLITFEADVSHGTYVRSLVSELGNITGTGAVTLTLLRTKVGKYTKADTEAYQLW